MPLRLVGSRFLGVLPATRTVLAASALLAAGGLLAGGCTRRATQLLVVIESDLPAARRACVRVEVAPLDAPSDGMARTYHLELDRDRHVAALPFSLGVTPPGGDATRRVEIRVSAYRSGPACSDDAYMPVEVTVQRRVRTGFLPEQALRLPIFLASDCDNVSCGPTETCDFGACVTVPDLEPETLVITSPGTELLDAGPLDAAIDDDAPADPIDAPLGTDAPGDVDPPVVDPPRPTRTIETSEAIDPHGRLYPVGVVGNDVIVAGITETGISADGVTVPAMPDPDAGLTGTEDAGFVRGRSGRFVLARLSAVMGAPPLQLQVLETGGAPYPVVERVIPLASGGFVVCGTASAPFMLPGGAIIAGEAARWAFVARLNDDLSFVPATVHRLDARASMMGAASPEASCEDLAVDGGAAYAAVRMWNASTPLMDSSPSLTSGLFDDPDQNLLLFEIVDPSGAFLVTTPDVVGGDRIGMAQDVAHYEGAPFALELSDEGDLLVGAEADDLTPGSTVPPGSPTAVRLSRLGSVPWSIPSLATTVPDVELHLEGMAQRDGTLFVVATVQLGMSVSADVTFQGAGASALGTLSVTADTSFLLRLDARSGAVSGATPLPEVVETAFEDTGAYHATGDLLYGAGLSVTADGRALVATSTSHGAVLGTTPLVVGAASLPQADPLLVIQAPSTPVRAWQWSTSSFSDWRLTHVEWLASGHVAVAGYVESTGPMASDRVWHREASFFQILPLP